MSGEPLLTKRQREKVAREIADLIGPMTDENDASVIRFVARQVERQTAEEVEFCRHDVRGRL